MGYGIMFYLNSCIRVINELLETTDNQVLRDIKEDIEKIIPKVEPLIDIE